jgi:hypothetical protein
MKLHISPMSNSQPEHNSRTDCQQCNDSAHQACIVCKDWAWANSASCPFRSCRCSSARGGASCTGRGRRGNCRAVSTTVLRSGERRRRRHYCDAALRNTTGHTWGDAYRSKGRQRRAGIHGPSSCGRGWTSWCRCAWCVRCGHDSCGGQCRPLSREIAEIGLHWRRSPLTSEPVLVSTGRFTSNPSVPAWDIYPSTTTDPWLAPPGRP